MEQSTIRTPMISPDFEPTIWSNFFINYQPRPLQMPEKWLNERALALKNRVSQFFEASKDMVEKMNLVDTVEHLGIGHHFENQIADTLRNIQHEDFNSSSLHEVSLRFRLLREHGLSVSPDDFNRFKDTNGRFKLDIINEPKGLLSLYNAAHLLTHDELVLDEAIGFARLHLESTRHDLEYPLAEQVKRALYLPLPRTVRRIEALHYMSEYVHEPACNPTILELAKIDFNILQTLHLKELKAVSEWWQDLYAEVELSYARDRTVQLYLWAHTMCYEQEYSCARITLTKLSALVTMMDDTYDVRATLEEGQNFNEAIQRQGGPPGRRVPMAARCRGVCGWRRLLATTLPPLLDSERLDLYQRWRSKHQIVDCDIQFNCERGCWMACRSCVS